ncbi:MAG: hypothetical protein AAF216_00895 [Pseudomonadota bacterium]
MRFSVYLRDDPERDYFTLINNKAVDVEEETLELKRCSAEDVAD